MSPVTRFTRFLGGESATLAFGGALSTQLRAGDVVVLSGDLGAGKTTLVRGVVGAIRAGIQVTSPTFALCHRYETDPPIAHVDCWRMEGAAELADLALDELLDEGWVALVEWGERLGDLYDDRALHLELTVEATGRSAQLWTTAERWLERRVALGELARAPGGR